MTTVSITAETSTKKLSSIVKDSVDNKEIQLALASHGNINPSSLNRLSKIACDDEVLFTIIANMNTKRTTLDALKKHPSSEVRDKARFEPMMRMQFSVEFGTGKVSIKRNGVEVEAIRNEAGWFVPRYGKVEPLRTSNNA